MSTQMSMGEQRSAVDVSTCHVQGRVGSEIVAAGADSASRGPQDRQNHANNEQDDPDGPQNRNLQQESGYEQDNSEDDHDEPF